MLYKKQLTKEQAIEKIKQFCVYQERSHNEVKAKLLAFGLKVQEMNEILCMLIAENYLNEERFARLFSGGKFRIKKWGRIKIKFELKQKGIGEYIIKSALNEINETEYRQTLAKLAERKMKELEGQPMISRLAKLQAYLLQKGYESSLISQTLKEQSRRESIS